MTLSFYLESSSLSKWSIVAEEEELGRFEEEWEENAFFVPDEWGTEGLEEVIFSSTQLSVRPHSSSHTRLFSDRR